MEANWNDAYWLDLDDKLGKVLALVGLGLIVSGYFLAREFPASLDVMQEQINEGEEDYIFTLLCEVLQEYRVPISPTAYTLMEDIGTMIAGYWADSPGDYTPNFPPEMWEELKPLIVSDVSRFLPG